VTKTSKFIQICWTQVLWTFLLSWVNLVAYFY